jgi:glucose-6-phosphate 1-epimerase
MEELATGIMTTQDPGGRSAITLEGAGGRVVIATTGAQVLSWLTANGDVLWTASYPEFKANKPVRGGVPVVFPWFGAHATDADLPQHGFARTAEWRVSSTADGPAVVLSTRDDEATRAMWPHAFALELSIALADELRLVLTVENPGDAPFTFEQALHSYFSVGDVREASVHGLEGVPFVEHATDGEANWDAAQPLCFRAETDRVFQGTPDELTLHAPRLRRRIRLRSENARSAIVWNPWPVKTARLSQMDADDWRRFCCIETANVGEHAVKLDPGARHTMSLSIAAEVDAG